jgi:cell division protein FtsW (lipid II flippase)
MSFFGLFVIILILISFSIIIAEELRRKEEKREHTKMENITIMVVGWALIILAIPLTIYLFISTSDDWKQLFITILGALKIYR